MTAARHIVSLAGGTDKALAVLEYANTQDVRTCLRALKVWKRLVDSIGEDAAAKAVDAFKGK
jgi:hypothetical protein